MTSEREATDLDHALASAAAVVLREGDHPAPTKPGEREVLAPAIEAGAVEVTEGGALTFTETAPLLDALIEQAAAQAADAWSDLDATADLLSRFSHLRYRLKLGDEAWTRLLVTLRSEYEVDVLARLREAAETVEGDRSHPLLWTMYREVCGALVELDPAPSHLAAQIAPVLGAVANDLAGGAIYGAVRRLAAVSEERAARLAEAFLQYPELRSVELIPNALLGLGDSNPARAHEWALELSESPQHNVRRAGAATLGWLSYDNDGGHERLGATMDRLDAMRSRVESGDEEEEVSAAVTQALGELVRTQSGYPFHERIEAAFLNIARAGPPQSKYVASAVVARALNSGEEAPWAREALLVVAGTPAEYRGIFERIDQGLHCLTPSAPDWCMVYLRAVVEGRDYGGEGEKSGLDDLFPMAVPRLIKENKAAVEAEITQWLASGNSGLQRAAGDIINDADTRAEGRSEPLQLDQGILPVLSEPERERVVFALLGYVYGGERLSRLLVSVVNSLKPDPKLGGLVVSALADAALYDYPGSAGEYLRSLVEQDETPGYARNLIAAALARSEAYYDALSDRPHLKELEAPAHRLRRYGALEYERQRQIRDMAESGSVFLDLVHRVPLKQGRAWFSERDGEFESPTRLGSFKSEMEIPRSLLLDPVGQQMRRVEWRVRASAADTEEQQ